MTSVADWILENRGKIEKGVEIMGQASEVLAATVGQLHPILEAVFVASAELLSNPEGKEARYLTEQFDLVNRKLEGIQDEIDKIGLELQKTTMNKQNFDREAKMLSQYEKFQDIVNAKPKFKEQKLKKFLSHYENTEADLNLDALYNTVIGRNIAGDPMLDTVVAIEQRSRRAVEDFCARLKKLFVVGIIAVMGYAALKEGTVGEEMVKKWQGQMEDVEKRMKAAVDDCIDNFADQARQDMEHQLQQYSGTVDSDLTKSLLDSLVKKYDWVSWSIRAFSEQRGFRLFNWLAGKRYHGSGGANFFDIVTQNKIKVVISFCISPKPIEKIEIQKQIEMEKIKADMILVTQSLRSHYPNCLVHTISTYKVVEEINNFPEDCYYYKKHRRAYFCIHLE